MSVIFSSYFGKPLEIGDLVEGFLTLSNKGMIRLLLAIADAEADLLAEKMDDLNLAFVLL